MGTPLLGMLLNAYSFATLGTIASWLQPPPSSVRAWHSWVGDPAQPSPRSSIAVARYPPIFVGARFATCAPSVAPKVLVILLDDVGFGASSGWAVLIEGGRVETYSRPRGAGSQGVHSSPCGPTASPCAVTIEPGNR